MRTLTLLLTALLAGAALAGCTGNDDGTDPTPATSTPEATPTDPFATTPGTPATTTPAATPVVTPPVGVGPTTYQLATSWPVTQAKPATALNYTLFVNGTTGSTSDHVGAHYANNDTTTPGPGRSDCPHTNGTLPGTFNLSCSFANTGTWHVYGHARVNQSGELVEWWAAPVVVRVRDYNLTATAPATATYGTNFTVTMNVTALGLSDNATSDHIGAHWFNNTEDSTTELAAGECQHVAGGVVGTFTLSCNVPQPAGLPAPKTVYVRGHVRITEGGATLSWWSAPVGVSVSALGGLPTFP